MPKEILDVVPGNDVEAAWGNVVRDRVTMRYTSQAALETNEPSAPAGSLRWTNDNGLLVRAAGEWVPVRIESGWVISETGFQFADPAQATLTWQLRSGDGSGSNPAWSFLSSTAVGLFLDSGNKIGVAGSGFDFNGTVLGGLSTCDPVDSSDVPGQGIAVNVADAASPAGTFATRFVFKNGTSRFGEIMVSKAGGSLWIRGVADNGPLYSGYFEASVSPVASAGSLRSRLASALPAAVSTDADGVTGVDTAAVIEHLLDRIEALENP